MEKVTCLFQLHGKYKDKLLLEIRLSKGNLQVNTKNLKKKLRREKRLKI